MPEASSVRTLFAGIAGRYDFANHLLSGGVDYYWRHVLAKKVAARQPAHVVDLATGSGDVAFTLARHLPKETSIQGLDFCEPMLDQARRKLQENSRLSNRRISFATGDCLSLPLVNASADAVTIAFGLRNLEDRASGLREMRRILSPGTGWLYVLEFTQPDAWLRPFYFLYLKTVLPGLAALTTRRRDAYEYLAGSIEAFPARPEISRELQDAGFTDIHATGLTGGIVAIHEARA